MQRLLLILGLALGTAPAWGAELNCGPQPPSAGGPTVKLFVMTTANDRDVAIVCPDGRAVFDWQALRELAAHAYEDGNFDQFAIYAAILVAAHGGLPAFPPHPEGYLP